MKTLTRRRAIESFDARGRAIVAAQGDEEAAAIYLTVGDGSSPSDPTAASKDATITGRTGIAETGVKITTGNDAYIKAVAADADGNLGPVTEFQQARRIGPFHQDTTTRSVTGTVTETELERIKIPGGVLGTNGALRLHASWTFTNPNASATVNVRFGSGGSLLATFTLSAAGGGRDVALDLLMFNDGSVSAQQSVPRFVSAFGSSANTAAATVDTSSDADLTIWGDLGNTSDQIDLEVSMLELIGTA